MVKPVRVPTALPPEPNRALPLLLPPARVCATSAPPATSAMLPEAVSPSADAMMVPATPRLPASVSAKSPSVTEKSPSVLTAFASANRTGPDAVPDKVPVASVPALWMIAPAGAMSWIAGAERLAPNVSVPVVAKARSVWSMTGPATVRPLWSARLNPPVVEKLPRVAMVVAPLVRASEVAPPDNVPMLVLPPAPSTSAPLIARVTLPPPSGPLTDSPVVSVQRQAAGGDQASRWRRSCCCR